MPTPAVVGASFTADTTAQLRDDLITFSYSFTNNGTQPLTGLSISDPLTTDLSCDATTADVGETVACSGTYQVTDASDSTVVSNAVFTAIDPADTVLTATTSVALVVRADPAMAITALIDAPVATVGSTVTVTYTVTNTGNVDIDDLKIRDLELGNAVCETEVLAPGESTTCRTSFELNMADITAGAIQLDSVATGDPALSDEPVVAELHEALPIDATLVPAVHLIFGHTLIF